MIAILQTWLCFKLILLSALNTWVSATNIKAPGLLLRLTLAFDELLILSIRRAPFPPTCAMRAMVFAAEGTPELIKVRWTQALRKGWWYCVRDVNGFDPAFAHLVGHISHVSAFHLLNPKGAQVFKDDDKIKVSRLLQEIALRNQI